MRAAPDRPRVAHERGPTRPEVSEPRRACGASRTRAMAIVHEGQQRAGLRAYALSCTYCFVSLIFGMQLSLCGPTASLLAAQTGGTEADLAPGELAHTGVQGRQQFVPHPAPLPCSPWMWRHWHDHRWLAIRVDHRPLPWAHGPRREPLCTGKQSGSSAACILVLAWSSMNAAVAMRG